MRWSSSASPAGTSGESAWTRSTLAASAASLGQFFAMPSRDTFCSMKRVISEGSLRNVRYDHGIISHITDALSMRLTLSGLSSVKPPNLPVADLLRFDGS